MPYRPTKATIWRAEGGIQDVSASHQGCAVDVLTFEDPNTSTTILVKRPYKLTVSWLQIGKKNKQKPKKLETTRIHVFRGPQRIWDSEFHDAELDFAKYKCDVTMPAVKLMQIIRGKKTGLEEEWAITEAIEKGNGGWQKGTTFKYADLDPGTTLQDMGWDKSRGKDKPPVWLVLHKVAVRFAGSPKSK